MPAPCLRAPAALAAALLLMGAVLQLGHGAAAAPTAGSAADGSGSVRAAAGAAEWHKPAFCGKLDCPEFTIKQVRGWCGRMGKRWEFLAHAVPDAARNELHWCLATAPRAEAPRLPDQNLQGRCASEEGGRKGPWEPASAERTAGGP